MPRLASPSDGISPFTDADDTTLCGGGVGRLDEGSSHA